MIKIEGGQVLFFDANAGVGRIRVMVNGWPTGEELPIAASNGFTFTWDACEITPQFGNSFASINQAPMPVAETWVAFQREPFQWGFGNAWMEVERRLYKASRLRIVQMKRGAIAKKWWTGDLDMHGFIQMRLASLLIPRTDPYGSDPLARAYVDVKSAEVQNITDGLVLQCYITDGPGGFWRPCHDRRAPVSRIPDDHWGYAEQPLEL